MTSKTPRDEEVPVSTSHDGYDLVGILGQGAFAKVYYAREKSTNREVAIKVIELENNQPQSWEEVRKETAIMHSLRHENVVSCLASFVVAEELWLVMPLLGGGSCAAVLRTHPEFTKGIKDEPLLATILKDVLEGLQYFHSEGRIHRDIKAGNILLSEDGDAKLSDFGVSGTLIENGSKKNTRMTFTGTPCWMAPEVMESKGHNTKADIWSFGITALELAFAKPPYADERPMKVMLLIMQKDPPNAKVYKGSESKDVFSQNFHDMVKQCLNKNPSKRPKAKDLLKHSWFKKAKGKKYVTNRILYTLPPRKVLPISEDKMPKSFRHKNTIVEDRSTFSQVGFDFSDVPRSQSSIRVNPSSISAEPLNEVKEESQQDVNDELKIDDALPTGNRGGNLKSRDSFANKT